MKTYEVIAIRDGKWWALEVPGLDMGFSQARRLVEVESVARELICLLTDAEDDSFAVTVRVDVPGADAVATAERLRADADLARRTADQAAKEAAIALVAQRIPVRDVATMLHVSPGWVSVLTRDGEVAA